MISLLLGQTVSFAARNGFQAIQFILLVILPQVFLSDLIWDIQSFPCPLFWGRVGQLGRPGALHVLPTLLLTLLPTLLRPAANPAHD